MTVLYFDCISGAGGDMLLAALIDAGVPQQAIRRSLDALDLSGWEVEVIPVMKGGLRASQVIVTSSDATTSRRHRDIRDLLTGAALDPRVRERALQTFAVLADAEATVHREDPDDVHFHEAGGIDAIIDVVGCAAAIEHLAPTTIATSSLVTGRGWTDAAHGRLPLPAPAVLEILRNVPLEERGTNELVTPTGAAILVTASDSFGHMPELRVSSVGYGAGARDLEWPNVVRVLVGEGHTVSPSRDPWLIETNIDDMTPEFIPHCIEMLIRAGASDAWTTSIVMKKGRPGFSLSVLVGEDSKDSVLDVLYRETTTLGARLRRVAKDELSRRWIDVEVEREMLRVKVGVRGGEVVTIAPEYEDAVIVARATGLSLHEVFERAKAAARAEL